MTKPTKAGETMASFGTYYGPLNGRGSEARSHAEREREYRREARTPGTDAYHGERERRARARAAGAGFFPDSPAAERAIARGEYRGTPIVFADGEVAVYRKYPGIVERVEW